MSYSTRSLKVAVVGAGAAGLVAARELLREGHHVTVFEQGSDLGGVWLYSDETDEDPLARDPGARTAHSSLYASVRTNLPREIMSFRDFPFTTQVLGPRSVDGRRYPCHQEVQAYLQLFADVFQLRRHIRFNCKVLTATPSRHSCAKQATGPSNSSTDGSAAGCGVGSGDGNSRGSCNGGAHGNVVHESNGDAQGTGWSWRVTSTKASAEANSGGHESAAINQCDAQTEDFDALVVCVGTYSAPNVPEIAGQDAFPGMQVHCHNYRRPEVFVGMTVVVIGASFSGDEIAREIAQEADKVYLAARTWPIAEWETQRGPVGKRGNVFRRSVPVRLQDDGSVTFPDGETVPGVGAIVYCTGYQYRYQFLEQANMLSTHDNRVSPLYKHVFHPHLAPSLAFVGILWKSLRFPQFELQAKWIARVLSGRCQLPPLQAMDDDTAALYRSIAEAGLPVRYTHSHAGNMPEGQWQYNCWLAQQIGQVPSKPGAIDWYIRVHMAMLSRIFGAHETYRDAVTTCEEELAAVADGEEEAAARMEAWRSTPGAFPDMDFTFLAHLVGSA